MRRTRIIELAACVALVALGALPAGAAASDVTLKRGVLGLTGAGEANDVVLGFNIDVDTNEGVVTLRDAAGLGSLPASCSRTGRTRAHCPARRVRSVRIVTGAGNDRALIDTSTGEIEWADEAVARLGPGNDTFRGGRGRDRAFGGPGRDRLFGRGGNDRLYAGRRATGDVGFDLLDGGSGDDLLRGNGNARCFGRSGYDTASSCSFLRGVEAAVA